MNKKFDRVLQWSKEKMGNDSKTSTTDEFKALEMEMQMRQDGMERLHSSANIYIKSLSKRREGDDREKMIPVDIVGQAMVSHGEEFEPDSTYGQCLTRFGRVHESISRVQETYVQNINDNWLLGLERDLTHMKEYQAARRKLESRRLAYDTAQSKMQKQKKEDFRLEDELRSQRIKYEELSDEVLRRMNDIRDGEQETLAELGAFLDAELEYYDRCRNLLMRVREQWPVQTTMKSNRERSRSTTAHSFGNGAREEKEYDEPPPEPRPSIKSRGISASRGDWDGHSHGPGRRTPEPHSRTTSWKVGSESSLSRTSSMESPINAPTRMLRTVTEPIPPPLPRGGSRPGFTRTPSYNTANEDTSPVDNRYSPEPQVRPLSRNASSQSLSASRRVVPPPPPPASRVQGKKPPPPPPPVKRSNLTALSVNQ
ncbi:hypothetical protein Dda_1002 [Drechslerella dactyloides]|uniref:BAR domain-containing protein n=1 Tax=Drechslerella dactyloides TaxID=74499 RepID=A0AAD6NN43_DREDA|nr:hypothetical protein Dda_1002 [Drechslerella dactyloides]